MKYVRCNISREHQQAYREICINHAEKTYTSPNTPQHNGIVERQFATDLTRANAMLDSGNLTSKFENSLKD